MGIVFDGEEDWREEVGKLEWRVFFFFSSFFKWVYLRRREYECRLIERMRVFFLFFFLY